MAGRLAGKAAVVTAAAQGIGRATVEAFLREGAEVWALDLNREKLGELEGSSGVRTLVLDATDGAEVRAAAERIGAPAILVNAVGWVHQGTLLDCGESAWDRSFEINCRSMYLVTRAFLPGMIAAGGGSVINIASAVSSIKGVPNRCAYASTKGAVIGFTKAVQADFIGKGIRCNAVCPGTVDTPSLGDRISVFSDPVAARAAFIARQPLGRFGTAEEVAEACVYLASDAAAFVVGTTMMVDGGMSL